MTARLIALAVAATFAATFAATAFAAPLKPEEQIKFRKAGYGFMAWNMGRIKNSLEGSYNKDEVTKAAAAVAAVSNAGLGALFGPGTDKDLGDVKTRVKPEFFQEQDKVKAQFGKTGEACKVCHDRYRKD